MSKFNVLRVRAENIGFFENKIFDIDFTNQMQVTNFDEHHSYYNIGSSIYLPKVVVIKGVNASGKTSILEMIDMFFSIYFERLPLKYALRSDFISKAFSGNEVKLTLFFEQGGKIFQITSTINSVEDNSSEEMFFGNQRKRYVISGEKIYGKSLYKHTKKTTLYDEGFELLHDRALLRVGEKTFLKDDESIISILELQTRQRLFTEIERMGGIGEQYLWLRLSQGTNAFDPQIIQFLDPSVKKIKRKQIKQLNARVSRQAERAIDLYEVHFANNEIYELTRQQLAGTLSAGTMRGIRIFSRIKEVLKTGGLYLVDELELHFHKSIIADIIKLFNNPDTNPHNAVLVFSTHYTEILDFFERNDQIFIVHRNEKYAIQISNYSHYDKKNHLKKSDAYFADSYELGTAISYEKYLELIKLFRRIHETD